MILWGNIVNAGAIILGGALGLLLKGKITQRYETHMIHAMGLGIIVLGITGAIEVRNFLVMLLALAIGAFVGELLDIEKRLENFTHGVKKRLNIQDAHFVAGFVDATLLFCVGAMAIVGSLESGLQNDHSTLIAKGLIDGVVSILMASTLGIGVVFSSISVFLYQGSIVLLSGALSPLLTEQLIGDMSSVGSVLILAIGLNMTGILKVKVGNLLPAILVAGIAGIFM